MYYINLCDQSISKYLPWWDHSKKSILQVDCAMLYICHHIPALWYAFTHYAHTWFEFWSRDLQAIGHAIYEGVNNFLEETQPVVLHRQARWHGIGINPVASKLAVKIFENKHIQNRSPLPRRTSG